MPDLQQPGPDRSPDEGPVPEDNLPGHHPADEQDKPDPADFVAKAKEVAARKSGARKATAPRTADRGRPTTSRPGAAGSAPSGGGGATPAPAAGAPRTGTVDEADAPTATPEAVVAQAADAPLDPPRAAPTSAPAPPTVQAPPPAQHPVAAVIAFQWRVATFPLRVAGEVLERLRRLR